MTEAGAFDVENAAGRNIFFCLRKERPREDLIVAFSYLMSGYKEVETIHCLEVHRERIRGNGLNRNSK